MSQTPHGPARPPHGHARPPHGADRHRLVLYRARFAIWVFIPQWIVIALFACISFLVLLLGMANGSGNAPALFVILVIMDVLLVLIAVASYRRGFDVAREGLTLISPLRTRRIGWGEVRVITVDPRPATRGATLVILRNGRRLVAPLTACRFAVFRGERISDHGPDQLSPALPTRAAIRAHREYLAAVQRSR